MKKIFAIAAGLIVLFVSCASQSESVGDSTIFTGTWKDDGGQRFVVAKSSFTWYDTYKDSWKLNIEGKEEEVVDSFEVPVLRGLYKVSGNTVTITFTQFNMREEKTDPDQWVAYAKLPAEIKTKLPQTVEVTISDNTFTTDFTGQKRLFTKGE